MKIFVVHPNANMNMRFSYKINKIKPFLLYLLQFMFGVNPFNSINTRCSFGGNTVKIPFLLKLKKKRILHPNKRIFLVQPLDFAYVLKKHKQNQVLLSFLFLYLFFIFLILKLINLFDFWEHYHYNPFYYLNTGLHLINMSYQLIHSSAFLSSGDNNIWNNGITFSKNFKMFLHLY